MASTGLIAQGADDLRLTDQATSKPNGAGIESRSLGAAGEAVNNGEAQTAGAPVILGAFTRQQVDSIHGFWRTQAWWRTTAPL